MNLLSLLLCLSIFIVSAAKTVDLFIIADKKLQKIQRNFIQETRKLHQNEKGSFSVMAAMITFILTGLLIFFVHKMKQEYKEATYRKESYLCFQYMNQQTKNYILHMAYFNTAIRTAYVSIPLTAGGSKSAWEALVIARNIRHFSYMKNLIHNKYCEKSDALSYVKNTPYRMNAFIMLQENIDKTSIVRQSKWTTSIYKIPRGVRATKAFCLKSTYELDGAFTSKAFIKTEELGSLNLKCFSGAS